MPKFTIMIFEAPYGREKPYTALRFALTALIDGYKVTVVLIQEGIFVAKKSQDPTEYPDILKYLQMAMDEGLKVIVCGVCCQARGIKQEDLIDNVVLVGMHEIVDACAQSDRNVSF